MISSVAVCGLEPTPSWETASHLQWELVCQEGAHQVAAVTSQPQQQEPDGDGTVHVARLARTVVLSARRTKKIKRPYWRGPLDTKAMSLEGGDLTEVRTP